MVAFPLERERARDEVIKRVEPGSFALSPWSSPRERSAAGYTFLFAIAWAAIALVATGRYRHRPSGEENAIAEHLARGEGFLSPMDPSASAPPTSWSPPAYPALISAAYRAFGLGAPRASAALGIFNLLCFAVVACALMQLAMVYSSRAAGAVALLCIDPLSLSLLADYWDGELGLSLFTLAVALAASWRRQRMTLPRAAALGALLGILSLANAAYLFAYPLIVLASCAGAPPKRKRALCAAALLAFAALLAPWTARNWQQFGRLLYVRGGAQLELWNGNRPGATGWLGANSFAGHPYANERERRALLSLGEMAYFDLCGERFRDEVMAEPAAFAVRTLRRAGYLVFGNPWSEKRDSLFAELGDWMVLELIACLGLAGAWTAWRLRRDLRWLLGATALSIAPFLFTSACDRYALPLRTMAIFFGALLAAAGATRIRAARARAQGPGPESV